MLGMVLQIGQPIDSTKLRHVFWLKVPDTRLGHVLALKRRVVNFVVVFASKCTHVSVPAQFVILVEDWTLELAWIDHTLVV